MGNCMETYTIGQQNHAEEKQQQQQQQQDEEGGRSRRFVKVDGNEGKNGLSMKVVLTKEELKWLILKLKEKGGMRVEEIVAEIERGREEKVEGWKPSLDSIMEAPEMLEMDTTPTSSFS